MPAAPYKDPGNVGHVTDWRDRLPGSARDTGPAAYTSAYGPNVGYTADPYGVMHPNYTTASGYADYIFGHVPGIDAQGRAAVQAAIAGGGFQNLRLGMRPDPGGGGPHRTTPYLAPGAAAPPAPPPQTGLTESQWRAIMGLSSQGASSIQPGVPGGAHFMGNAGPLVQGTPGQQGWTNFTGDYGGNHYVNGVYQGPATTTTTTTTPTNTFTGGPHVDPATGDYTDSQGNVYEWDPIAGRFRPRSHDPYGHFAPYGPVTSLPAGPVTDYTGGNPVGPPSLPTARRRPRAGQPGYFPD